MFFWFREFFHFFGVRWRFELEEFFRQGGVDFGHGERISGLKLDGLLVKFFSIRLGGRLLHLLDETASPYRRVLFVNPKGYSRWFGLLALRQI